MINIGEELRYHREKRGISQNKLSKETGISQQNISYWENNEREPSITFCIKLADYYEISLDELIGRDISTNGKFVNSFNNFNNSGTIDIK